MSGKAITGHVELIHPSKYIKAADLRGKDVTVVIDKLEWEDLVMAGGKRDRKVAIVMRSKAGRVLEKKWIAPKTVLRQIAAVLAEKDVGKWGKGEVTLYPTTCRGADGGMVECIRVRVRTNARAGDVPEDMAAPVPPEQRDFVDDADDAPDDARAAAIERGAP